MYEAVCNHHSDVYVQKRKRSQGTTRRVPPTNMTAAAPSVKRLFPNGDLYIGSVSGNVPHGSGKYWWKDGCTYEGEWCHGKASGNGKFSWPCGATFEGEFMSGRMEGHGKFNGPDGCTSEGNWSANRIEGFAWCRYANGDLYGGFWKKNRKNGLAAVFESNGTQYVGVFKNDVLSGFLVRISANGNRYEDQWVMDVVVPEQLRTFVLDDGSLYTVYGSDPNGDLAAQYDGLVMDEDDGECEIGEAVVREICVEAWERTRSTFLPMAGSKGILLGGRKVSSWAVGPLDQCTKRFLNGFFFAVKEVSLLDEGSPVEQSIFQLGEEIGHLSQFEHENIVQYYGTDKDESKMYVFLELVTKGSLLSLYQRYTLEDSQVSSYTRQILHGLRYLHDRGVVHRDIKCANILVDANGSVKIADFGLAKVTKLNDVKSCKGTAFWMAPEVVNHQNQGYGLPADIWSLGCTVLEMLTRQIPYSPLECMQALFRIGKGEPPPVPDSLSNDARDFILQCLQVNPNNRPTATQLLLHSFVRR